jgi:hypothetical protein
MIMSFNVLLTERTTSKSPGLQAGAGKLMVDMVIWDSDSRDVLQFSFPNETSSIYVIYTSNMDSLCIKVYKDYANVQN